MEPRLANCFLQVIYISYCQGSRLHWRSSDAGMFSRKREPCRASRFSCNAWPRPWRGAPLGREAQKGPGKSPALTPRAGKRLSSLLVPALSALLQGGGRFPAESPPVPRAPGHLSSVGGAGAGQAAGELRELRGRPHPAASRPPLPLPLRVDNRSGSNYALIAFFQAVSLEPRSSEFMNK